MRVNRLELAQANRDLVRSNAYGFCEIGRGALDFAAVLHALRVFSGWLIVETEDYEVPPGDPAGSTNQQEGLAEAWAQLTELNANVMFLACKI